MPSTNIQAVNNFVFIKRDEAETTAGNYILPDQSQQKPHSGNILSVGGKVDDPEIKEGKRCIFHQGTGFEIEFEGETFLVMESAKIIGVV